MDKPGKFAPHVVMPVTLQMRCYAQRSTARRSSTASCPETRLLIGRARRESTYEIDAVPLMRTSEHWIPIEGKHELPLVDALITQHRRFVKPAL